MKILILIDASGGISQECFDSVLKDIEQYIPDNQIGIGCFDIDLHNFQEIKSFDDIKNYKMIGGGGTFLQEPLKEAINLFGFPEKIIVYSDFYIYDDNLDYVNSISSNIEIEFVKIGDLYREDLEKDYPKVKIRTLK